MTITPALFQKRLLAWFDRHGRQSLPWQHDKTPYRVWISEIMLQQTQVNTVIPYYQRFMERFPTLEALAAATEDDVLHLWTGLGYYSRARNIRRAAHKVVEQFAGVFPSTVIDLTSLPGIGTSTAGAIRAIAFQQHAPILDGNVKRVLTRLHGITQPVNEKKTEDRLWELASRYTPIKRVDDYTQAIMDLGATFCTRSKPACTVCPFQSMCVAHQQGIETTLPAKTAKQKIPVRTATFLVFKQGEQVLLEKRAATGIWGGLYSLPEMAGQPSATAIRSHAKKTYGMTAPTPQALPSFRHTFSHYHLDIFPILIEIGKPALKKVTKTTAIWYNLTQPKTIGLPKPILSILRGLT